MKELIERAASELANSRHAIVLTGAGMSTESGIPDFRGPKGIWTTNREAEAKAYERYDLYLRSPESYWAEMMGGEGTHGAFYQEMRRAEPNPGHYALAELEQAGVLKEARQHERYEKPSDRRRRAEAARRRKLRRLMSG